MTNQASELNELKKPSERKKLFDRLVFMFSWKGETRWIKANRTMKAIDQYTESLIRTEKLKLLAEVRERVVGEDVEPHYELCTEPEKYCVCSSGTRNNLRKKQQTELTKLEAEL